MTVIATAGHVDHGKSTLVRALTGTDPDRWAEEKRRGLTIDLGFANTTLPSGEQISFVDVPGHGRFVANMLSGVGSVDACMFVVDANEGWRAQSEEHLRILELLGMRAGVIAMTKVASLDEDLTTLAAEEITEHVQGTFLQDAPVVAVDAPAGRGIDDLRQALDRLVSSLPPAVDGSRPRLWVDRSFSIRGAGTVVTGTLLGGSLSAGDELVIEPGARRVRARGLQSHNQPCDHAGPGRRVAVNLTGVEAKEIRRGQALVRPDQWHVTAAVDVSLSVLDASPQPVTNRGAFAVHLGTAALPVRLRLIGSRDQIAPGEDAPARMWLLAGHRVTAVPGDRFVLRELGRGQTIGGGVVLDVDPVLPASKADPSLSVERVVEERGWVRADHLERLTGRPATPTVGAWVVAPAAEARAAARISELCEHAGAGGVDLAQLGETELALLHSGIDGVTVSGPKAYLDSLVPRGISERASAVLNLLEKDSMSPPDLPVEDRRSLRELEATGLATQAGEIWFASSAVEAAVDLLRALLRAKPDGFTVSDARQVLGTSRKYALPLLAHLDANGITRRKGDTRVAGPRMGL
ncbi:MAG TPA: selenocysteine-specific translation elongation factor [Acidimicrobiales bacterium]|nr:selenocysteine-specific translation elongation factor [Acidimicrobiales bacterium]